MKIYFYETEENLLQPNIESLLNALIIKSLGKNNKNLTLHQAPDDLKSALGKWNGNSDLSYECMKHLPEDTTNIRVLILTTPHTPFYTWGKNLCPHGDWGYSNDFISIDYSPSDKKLFNQLHECLHFLGIDDCYTNDRLLPKATCDNQSCIMRYGNTSIDICSSVMQQLQQRYNK